MFENKTLTITENGLVFQIDNLEENIKFLKYIKKHFTLIYQNHIVKVRKEVKLFKLNKKLNQIIIPRFGFNKIEKYFLNYNIVNKLSNGEDKQMNYIGKSNENQKVIISYLMKNIFLDSNPFSGCTLKARTGTGKTFIAMDFISKINKKTFIIVPNTYLLNQWVELLTEFFPDNKIGVFYSKSKIEGDIIISTIHSSLMDKFVFKDKKTKIITEYSYKEFYNKFGLIIYDESHIYCTNTFKKIFLKAQCKNMLGLSATPNERLDTFDYVSHSNIGEVLDVETIENYKVNNIKFKSKIKLVYFDGHDDYTNLYINEKTGLISTVDIISELISDPFRNNMIIKWIYKLFNLNLNVFVFSERRSHLLDLYNLFKNKINEEYYNNLCIPEENINSNILYGGSSKDDIQYSKDKSRIIFTTYQYSSTGVSIVKMNALLLVTPRKNNITQIVGRIFRLSTEENNSIKRYIIDIIDNKTVLKNQVRNRKKIYNLYTDDITIKECSYKDYE